MEKRFITLSSSIDLERAYPIMSELRPHLTFPEFKEIYEMANKYEGYQIVAIEEGGQLVALMGFRFLSDFVRGRHLYIDDLVCAARARSRGLGAELLAQAESLALKSCCKTLRLCTGIENDRAMAFYERVPPEQGMSISSIGGATRISITLLPRSQS